MSLHNRRMFIGGAIGGVLLLGAIGVAIVYFFAFPSSAPGKLSLASTSSPTASTSASASPATASAGSLTVTSVSQSGYRVRENLAFVGALSDSVGMQSAVYGSGEIKV